MPIRARIDVALLREMVQSMHEAIDLESEIAAQTGLSHHSSRAAGCPMPCLL